MIKVGIELKLPQRNQDDTRPSDITIYTFTESGKAQYALGIKVDKIVEGVHYFKTFIPYTTRKEEEITFKYPNKRRYYKQKSISLK